ncbi:hypothetical protein BWI17_09690 [Betaproteobacteria bacterium GR16-43]|nr:hypothetical protein BWI17_09690 [Betaproteobacteria bacterium GR16-43]
MWAAVLIGAALVFAPLSGIYFLADDFVPLVLLRHWQDEGRIGAELAARFHGGLDPQNHFYRPLSYASFALNYFAGGTNATSWLAVNVALHGASAAMAGAIGVMAAGARGARAWIGAAAGAALFLFFSPSAEVIAWISGRFDVSATFFALLSCLLFLRSRTLGDRYAVLSLASGVAAFLCKESAGVLPFAILMLACIPRDPGEPSGLRARAVTALRRAAPWLALAAIYLVARYVFFGTFTKVYVRVTPVPSILSAEYWIQLAASLPAFLAAQFRPQGYFPAVLAFTAVQLGAIAYIAIARETERQARQALFALGTVTALTVALVVPHVVGLLANGLGGRLAYNTAAFYAALVAAAFAFARPAWPLWGTTLVLVLLHAGSQSAAIGRSVGASAQMRSLVAAVEQEARKGTADDYTLVLIPPFIDDVIFGLNAQGGLMLPPIQERSLASRVVVQTFEDLTDLQDKIADHLVPTLRRRTLMEYLGGARQVTSPAEYPTRIVCWNVAQRRFVPVVVQAGPGPKAYVEAIERALGGLGCVGSAVPR